MSSRIWQLTCSPVHNAVPAPVRMAFRAAWTTTANWVGYRWARRRDIAPPTVWWERTAGPHFRNQVAVLTITGSDAEVTFQRARHDEQPITVALTD